MDEKDKKILCNQEHYVNREREWIEKHKYYMGLEQHRDISRNEAVLHFIMVGLSAKYQEWYFKNYQDSKLEIHAKS